jgi:hypothetical protein
VLVDDFPGGDPGELWQLGSSDTTVGEVNGEAEIAIPNNSMNGSWGEFDSRRAYDFRGDSVSVEVTNATNPATTAQSWFGTGYTGNYLQISQKHGVLRFEYQLAGVTTSLKTTPYDPVAHRHWRFRDDGVNTYWETSSDGSTWKVMTQVATATLFPMNIMWVWMGGGSDGGEINPGVAHFDHVNGGGAPKEKWCPLSSFKDDFNDAANSLAWKRGWEDVPGMVARTGGQLTISLVPNQSSSATYATSTSFDLTGSSVVVEVPTAVTSASGSETAVSLFLPGDNGIELSESQNHLHFGVQKAGTWTSNGSMIYTAALQRWWRLRESAGTLYWDTSPDGKNWTSQAQLTPIPFPIDAVDLYLGGNGWASQPSPGASGFDNVNLPPP